MGLFSDLFKDLKPGAVWVRGELLQRLAASLDADRARLAQGCGSEICTTDGRYLFPAGAGGAAAPVYFPWQVLPVQTDSGPKLAVCSYSRVFSSPDPTATYTVSGLVGAWPPQADDANLFDVPAAGTFIRLAIDTQIDGVFSTVANTAAIDYATPTWTGYPAVVVKNTDDPDHLYQQQYIVPLAYVSGADDTTPGIVIDLGGGAKVKLIQLFGGRSIGMSLGSLEGLPVLVPDDPAPLIPFNEA